MSRAWRGKVVSTPEFDRWFKTLDESKRKKLQVAIKELAACGFNIRGNISTRLVGNGKGLSELRVQTLRALYAFDRNQNAVLLCGGDKAGEWTAWYEPAIRLARKTYAAHLASLPHQPGAAK